MSPEAEQDTSAASPQAAEHSGRGDDSPTSSRRRTTAPAPAAAPLDDRALDQIAEQQSRTAF